MDPSKSKLPVLSVLLVGCILTLSIPTTGQMRHWIAPEWADTLKNENLLNPAWIAEGKMLYMAQCVVCHGETGRGEGDSGFGLEVPPGDFNDDYTRSESDGAIFWKITYGKLPMPQFQSRATETQRWQMVAYIRELQRSYCSWQVKKK